MLHAPKIKAIATYFAVLPLLLNVSVTRLDTFQLQKLFIGFLKKDRNHQKFYNLETLTF